VALRLQTRVPEALEVKRTFLVLALVAAPAFAAGSLLTSPPVISSPSVSRVTARPDLIRDEALDAYGNEVTTAVAEYSLDSSGDLYERHSPQTELPHLGAPES
jgi:hypothetical protein